MIYSIFTLCFSVSFKDMVFLCLMFILEKTLAIELKNVLTSKTFSNLNESLHWERERERESKQEAHGPHRSAEKKKSNQ